jgi:uncharacterized protein (DUF427 family)
MAKASAPERTRDRYTINMVGPLIEPSPRWIRVKLGDTLVADTRRALLLREYGPGRLPTYYFPEADVRMDLLDRTSSATGSAGTATWTVRAGSLTAENAAWMPLDLPPERAALQGHLTFAWDKGLTWFEEEEQVFVHARDPYKRVDTMASSRHVKVVIAGTTVAETDHPTLLFETSLPIRYYLPQSDVRMDMLEPSAATTRCPYKGLATYWSARAGDTLVRNVVWSYQDPIRECPKIKGLLCFFNERVDLYVDGELQGRPITPWSRE